MATSGIGGIILTIQAHFYAALTAAVQALKAEGVGLMSLATVGFLYGIFHAAGPGHGKGVISGYIIASKGSISHGLALSLAAALLQAIVAIVVVGVFAVVLEATAATINAAARNIELVSFAPWLHWERSWFGLPANSCSGSRHPQRCDSNDDDATFQIQRGCGKAAWEITLVFCRRRPGRRSGPVQERSSCSSFTVAGLFAAALSARACHGGRNASITTGTLASLTVFKAMVQRLTSRGGMTGPIASRASSSWPRPLSWCLA